MTDDTSAVLEEILISKKSISSWKDATFNV